MNIRRSNLIVGIITIVVSSIFYYPTLSFPPSPRPVEPGAAFFPRLMLIVFIILSIGLIIEGIGKKGARSPLKIDLRNPVTRKKLSLLVLTLSYIIILPYAGFLICTLLYLLILAKLLGTPGYVKIAAISIGVTIALYYVFRMFLNVPLPTKLPFF